MSKRQQKIDIIRKYIGNASGTWPAYSYGNIPHDKLSNACRSYANANSTEDVLGLIDITIAGSGKKGMLFTEDIIYYDNGMMGSKGSISYKSLYKSLRDDNCIPGAVIGSTYNQTALKEMIITLAYIEGKTFVDSVENTIDNIDGIVGTIDNWINKLDTIFGDDNGNY